MNELTRWSRLLPSSMEMPTVRDRIPGASVAGASLVAAPLCLLVGNLLKAPHHFYFTNQIEAFADPGSRLVVGYVVTNIGFILLWPALLYCAQLIGRRRAVLGRATAVLTMLGVLGNVAHESVNFMAFQITREIGPDQTTDIVSAIYGDATVAYSLTWTDNAAWMLLGVGLYMTRGLDLPRAVCVLAMAAHHSGVLKGFSIFSVVLDTLLCLAFVTLGVQVLMSARRRVRDDLVGSS